MLLCVALTLALAGSSVTFTVVGSGPRSGVQEARTVEVRTAADWAALWKEHAPGKPAPEMDFASTMVVGVFLGGKPTSGYSVEIERVVKADDTLVIEYVERQPGPDTIVAQVLTSPFQIISVPQHKGAVRFRKLTKAPE